MSDPARLFLITPPIADAAAFAPLLQSALAAADTACVLLRAAPADMRATQDALAPLVPVVQQAGAAALLESDPRLAVRLGADGVHVAGAEDDLHDALSALKPDRIVGVGRLSGRDDAMRAGEAGVDYLMFGGPGQREGLEDVRAQVQWWAEIFNVPCVGYVADPERTGEMAAAGAEFVALCEGVWDHPEQTAAVLGAAHRALSRQPEFTR